MVEVRMIWKMEQVKPLFSFLPVHTPITVGVLLRVHQTIETSDAGRPDSACVEFIPLEPLLDIVGMQDRTDGFKHFDVSFTQAACPLPTPLPVSSTDVKVEDVPAPPSPESMGRHLARKDLEHACGTCVPCSFFALREDGCRHGDACPFCHLCSNKREVKAQRRQTKKGKRRRSEAMNLLEEAVQNA